MTPVNRYSSDDKDVPLPLMVIGGVAALAVDSRAVTAAKVLMLFMMRKKIQIKKRGRNVVERERSEFNR